MTSVSRSGSATYELTVVGTLGPVLQRALEPYASAARQPQTILRASLRESGDLVDLLEVLEARGLDITNITAL
jgi:hypothetical protein